MIPNKSPKELLNCQFFYYVGYRRRINNVLSVE